MIKVDGRETGLNISDFQNLEEILIKIRDDDSMRGRAITDVLVNDENFSEIYPHQAEDLSTDNISTVEIRSVEEKTMAKDVAGELPKVSKMMKLGARGCASLFREGKDNDGLELLQDLLDVTRDFMKMLEIIRDHYLGGADESFVSRTENFSNLISEMSEVLENEDWVLLADLLEFEFVPQCEEWGKVGEQLHQQLERSVK